MQQPRRVLRWLFSSNADGPQTLLPRWILLRALAVVYASAFASLLPQIKGLIGPRGILPAQGYLMAVAQSLGGAARFWYAPSLFWISASSHALIVVTVIGLLASVAALLNLWPRVSFLACFVCFLSFVAVSSEFSGYQSDGMLLEAGFLALFFAPRGLRPGLGASHPPSRASLFLLQWEWFRIYFESGLVKWLSGDSQWRNLTAMNEYYQNSPLPTWIGWYVAHLPFWFHKAATAGTLLMEFVVVLLLFLPARFRLICFLIVTPWEIGVILTGNYAFLNYLVLSSGLSAVDGSNDRAALVPRDGGLLQPGGARRWPRTTSPPSLTERAATAVAGHAQALRLAVSAVMLSLVGYVTTAELLSMPFGRMWLPAAPVSALEPFRIANQYGLFAVMTRGRYEVEFQGSEDGQHWTAYPFRSKPQALNEAPGLYAPYQPRFDWNLWFASLGDWQQNQIVPLTEERLLTNDADVLALFRGNPFPQQPPRYVRAVLWQYWFTSRAEKRQTGNWWRRRLLGQYAPTLRQTADGEFVAVQPADSLPPHD